MATATAACPDTNPRPLSWWPRRWTLSSRSTGRQRPTWSLIHLAASHTPMPVMARLAASHNPRAAATPRRPPGGEHVAGRHDQPERREQGGREVVDQPEQVLLEHPDVVGADGGDAAEEDGQPGHQPEHVAGVARQGQDL